MPTTTLSADIRHYAISGAQARLVQLSQEADAIHRLFPELRNGATQKAEPAAASAPRPPRRGRRRTMSAAERNAVSERMKKYWAARRGGSKTAESTSSEAAAKTTKPARGSAKRGPRTLSSEARKRISDAQKARWVKQRGEGKATASSSATEATAAKGRRAAKRPGPAGVKRGPRKLSATARKRMSHSQKKRWAAKRAAQ